MALKAGRVGVRSDQVDVHGIVKDNSTPYVLPTASASTLGGVKAVPKTEAMTKEVGIGSDGKLYVEPSSGGGVEEYGIGTLLSTVDSGYCNYVVIDGICYCQGIIKIGTTFPSGAYKEGNVVSGLPHLYTGDETITSLHCGVSAFNISGSSYLYCYNFVINTEGVLTLLARNAAAYNYTIAFNLAYPVSEDFVLDTVDLEETGFDIGECYKLYNDKYCLLSGNFKYKGSSAPSVIKITDDIPSSGAWLFNNICVDNQNVYNKEFLEYLDDQTYEAALYLNNNEVANSRIDFGVLYVINEGE